MRIPTIELERDILPLVRAIAEGFTYDPGRSDLDDEQPITVRMTLGDYRRAKRLQERAILVASERRNRRLGGNHATE